MTASHKNAVANELDGVRESRPPFDPPLQTQSQTFHVELSKVKEMEIDMESSHPKVARA
jgi:hypothetical protein